MGMEHPQAKPWGGGIQTCEEKPEGEYCPGGKAKAFASQRAILETQMNLSFAFVYYQTTEQSLTDYNSLASPQKYTWTLPIKKIHHWLISTDANYKTNKYHNSKAYVTGCPIEDKYCIW